MTLTIAQRLGSALDGRYVLERELGAGGMATVWLAKDVKHQRAVAIKVLRPELTAVLGAERFLAEIRLTAQLDHPHILTLIDSGEADGLLYYVLPYVRGESLRARLDREKQLPIDDAVRLVQQVASALAYAHERRVVHRDIKPENILLHEGEAVVTDFGIALALREAGGTRLTESGLSLGTPQYMSPEQATGDRELDARSDVYSLGAVLYELLTGDPPHSGATVQAVIAKLLAEKPTALRTLRSTVPEALEVAVFKALAKVPADRFANATQFAQAIGTALTVPERVPHTKSPTRTRIHTAFLLGVGALLGGAAVWFAAHAAASGRADRLPPAVSVSATFNGDVIDFALAPDAQRLALGRLRCNETGQCETRVEVRDVRGGISLPLTSFRATYGMGWSRDGRFIDVIGVDSVDRLGLFRVSSLGGPVSYLGLYVNAQHMANSDSLFVATPLPNGVRVGVVLPGETLLKDTLVLRGSAEWAITPNGKNLVAMDRQRTPTVLRMLDRRGRPLDSLTVSEGAAHVTFAPRGDVLLWLEDGIGGVSAKRVAVDPSSGRFVGDVATLIGPFNMPQSFGGRRLDVAADGTVAYISGVTPRVLQLLARRQPGALPTVERRIETQTGRMRAFVSPDGATIALSRLVPTGALAADQLLALDVNTGAEREISPALDRYLDAVWTRDGTALIYASYERGVGTRLVRWDRATGVRRPVGTYAGRALELIWTLPDESLLTIGADEESIEKLAAGTGDRVRRYQLPRGEEVAVVAPSPDGRQAATMSWAAAGDSVILGGLNLETGAWREFARRFAENTGTMRWLANGMVEFTLSSAVSTSELFSLDPRDGSITRRGELPVPFATYNLSVDGRVMTAVERRLVSDVFLFRPGNAAAQPR